MKNNVYFYILLMAFVSFLIRSLPLTLIRKPIRSRFLHSFLYYVPYVTLAVMTFPAILWATANPWVGFAALVVGGLFAWLKKGLFSVALASCITVFLLEFFL